MEETWVARGRSVCSLTDIIYKTWAGKTAKEYKKFKVEKENLRDNMTNTELVLNMLAELSTTRISETSNPETMEEHSNVASGWGNSAMHVLNWKQNRRKSNLFVKC